MAGGLERVRRTDEGCELEADRPGGDHRVVAPLLEFPDWARRRREPPVTDPATRPPTQRQAA